jgi:sterol desaturase/sphingolipid hydroxylase (fatty acid hydroxylase superfamily)
LGFDPALGGRSAPCGATVSTVRGIWHHRGGRRRALAPDKRPADRFLAVIDSFASWLQALPGIVVANFVQVLLYPLNPVQRVYWLYVVSSLLLASVACGLERRRGGPGEPFLRFCFPKQIWDHPSAWLDVRYFFFHHTLLRSWMYGGLVVSISAATAGLIQDSLQRIAPALCSDVSPATIAQRLVLTLVSILAVDLTGFGAHVLQHRVPLLWEFHRVHHSLTVMHPLSNYREHPIDNGFYSLVNGISLGVSAASAACLLGCELRTVDVLGINVFHFAFNFLGYNLRHSHIWLRWPSWLGYVFGSPAYHQIHHSVDVSHRNRNFAFLFPVWDWLLGTMYLPREREPLRFGLGDGTELDYNSVFALYAHPFERIARGAHQQRRAGDLRGDDLA